MSTLGALAVGTSQLFGVFLLAAVLAIGFVVGTSAGQALQDKAKDLWNTVKTKPLFNRQKRPEHVPA